MVLRLLRLLDNVGFSYHLNHLDSSLKSGAVPFAEANAGDDPEALGGADL